MGLNYYNARWYDAGTGRFISEDPARDGQNWYTYVTNNPLKFVDPTGMTHTEEYYEAMEDAMREQSEIPEASGRNGRDDGGSEPPKKDEPEKKSLWGKFVENAQNAYRQNKMQELLENAPDEVLDALFELGIIDEDFSGVIGIGRFKSTSAIGSFLSEKGVAYVISDGLIGEEFSYSSTSWGADSTLAAGLGVAITVIPEGLKGDFLGNSTTGGISAGFYGGGSISSVLTSTKKSGVSFSVGGSISPLPFSAFSYRDNVKEVK